MYKLSSTYNYVSDELCLLREYFAENCYPMTVFDNLCRKLLNNIYKLKLPQITVPKIKYVPTSAIL